MCRAFGVESLAAPGRRYDQRYLVAVPSIIEPGAPAAARAATTTTRWRRKAREELTELCGELDTLGERCTVTNAMVMRHRRRAVPASRRARNARSTLLSRAHVRSRRQERGKPVIFRAPSTVSRSRRPCSIQSTVAHRAHSLQPPTRSPPSDIPPVAPSPAGVPGRPTRARIRSYRALPDDVTALPTPPTHAMRSRGVH